MLWLKPSSDQRSVTWQNHFRMLWRGTAAVWSACLRTSDAGAGHCRRFILSNHRWHVLEHTVHQCCSYISPADQRSSVKRRVTLRNEGNRGPCKTVHIHVLSAEAPMAGLDLQLFHLQSPAFFSSTAARADTSLWLLLSSFLHFCYIYLDICQISITTNKELLW